MHKLILQRGDNIWLKDWLKSILRIIEVTIDNLEENNIIL